MKIKKYQWKEKIDKVRYYQEEVKLFWMVIATIGSSIAFFSRIINNFVSSKRIRINRPLAETGGIGTRSVLRDIQEIPQDNTYTVVTGVLFIGCLVLVIYFSWRVFQKKIAEARNNRG